MQQAIIGALDSQIIMHTKAKIIEIQIDIIDLNLHQSTQHTSSSYIKSSIDKKRHWKQVRCPSRQVIIFVAKSNFKATSLNLLIEYGKKEI